MRVLFCDLETSGLNPDVDVILEVGAILYDIRQAKELWRGQWIVAGPEARFRPMDRVVHEMHTKSGLFDAADSDDGGHDLVVVEIEILEMLRDQGLGPQACIMAGFSPHFDRSFLRVEMPWLERYLHHRLIDVSTLRELTFAWTGSKPEKIDKHRAIPDCEEAIATLMTYRKLLAPPVEAIVLLPASALSDVR